MKIIKIFLFIIIISGCKQKEKKTILMPNFKLKFVKKIESDNISCISKIVNAGNYYYVSDWQNNKIYKFSSNNDKFVKSFGGKGKGPGEFSKLTDIAINHKFNIYTADQNLNRIQIFDSEGNFIKTIKTEFANVGIVVKNENVFVNSLSPLYAIYEYDKFGHIIKKFIKLKKGQNNLLEMLSNISRFTYSDKKIYRILYNSPNIYTIIDTSISICHVDNTVKKYQEITFSIDNGAAKINRGSIVHSDIITDKNYIYVVGGGGNLENPENKLNHFLNIYDKKWNLLAHIWSKFLPYSVDGYSICKINNFFYFATINENVVYKFKLEVNNN